MNTSYRLSVRRRKHYRALLVMLSSMIGTTALAGQYRLLMGRGTDVCDAYRSELQSRNDPVPMACERQHDPKVKDFSSPPWRRLDIERNIDLFRQAWATLQKFNDAPQGTKLSEETIRATAAKLTPQPGDEIYTVQLDLLGNGRTEKLLALRKDSCGPDQAPGMHQTSLFALDSSGKHIDENVPDIWNSYYNATLELYKGHVYIEFYEPADNWQSLLTGAGFLDILRYTRTGVERVCRLQWSPEKG